MPISRMTTRRWMIAVALAALGAAAGRHAVALIVGWAIVLAVPSFVWTKLYAWWRCWIGKALSPRERTSVFVMSIPATLLVVCALGFVGIVLGRLFR